MLLKFGLSRLFLFAFCLYINCVLTLDILPDHDTVVKEVPTIKENAKPTVHTNPVDALSVNKKSGRPNVIEIPLDKHINVMDRSKNQGSESNKETSMLVLEGGGMVDLTSTAQPSKNLMDIGLTEDSNHSKGSKPRKGVQHPVSSVVPRKGVDPLGAFSLNQSSGITSDPAKESTRLNSNIDSQMSLNKTDPQAVDVKSTPKVTHPKKPVVVTDLEDVDDFEKYPIIQTSTTGEDYIIIGIVIVLGIWCSIFGALIFYRRAGEYWDRRHYRRMDFLVEGMYND